MPIRIHKILTQLHIITVLTLLTLPGVAAAIDKSSTVSDVTNGLNNSAQKLLKKAPEKGSYLLFRLAAEVRLVLNSWSVANNDWLTKPFNELKGNQKLLLSNIENLLNHIEKATSDKELEQLSKNWKSSLNLKPLIGSHPGISSFSHSVIAPLKNETSVNIAFKGSGLQYGTPVLIFQDQEYQPIDNSVDEISFQLATDNIEFKEKRIKIQNATLLVYKPGQRANESPGQTNTVEYKIPFMIMPKSLGNYKIISEYTQVVDQNGTFRNEFRHSSKEKSLDCRLFQQGPSIAGRKMENIRRERAWGQNGTERLIRSNSEGFTIEVCAARQNKPYQDYPPGSQNVIYVWDEYWQETQNSKSASLGKFEWDKDIVVTFEKNTTQFETMINTFDGRELKLDDNGRNTFFDAHYNSSANELKITYSIPKSISEL